MARGDTDGMEWKAYTKLKKYKEAIKLLKIANLKVPYLDTVSMFKKSPESGDSRL